ncbi:unnamed protein product, partial [Polarella glacialis]
PDSFLDSNGTAASLEAPSLRGLQPTLASPSASSRSPTRMGSPLAELRASRAGGTTPVRSQPEGGQAGETLRGCFSLGPDS